MGNYVVLLGNISIILCHYTASTPLNFIATHMGRTDALMVYKVYGKWMSGKSAEQVSLLNQALSRFAPSLPQNIVSAQ